MAMTTPLRIRRISCYDGDNDAEKAWTYPSGLILRRVYLTGYASFTLANASSPLFVALSYVSAAAGTMSGATQDDDFVLAEIIATYPLGTALADREIPVARQQFDFEPGLALHFPGTLYLNAYCGDGDAIVRGEAIIHWTQ